VRTRAFGSRFVAARGEAPEDPALARAIEVAAQPAAIISSRALERSDALCVRALDIFARAYGAVAGDLALTVLATGGVYVGGGIAPRILAKLKDGAFMDAFRDKGRLQELARRVPVRVVVSPRAGLIGAAVVASET